MTTEKAVAWRNRLIANRERRRGRTVEVTVIASPPFPEAPEPESVVAEIDATEAAKTLAADHGLDLAGVAGTGVGGRITVADVRASVEGSE